jgi:hypothetical protein
MMEKLLKRAGQLAVLHTDATAQALAEMVRAELPPGIQVERVSVGITLVGRGLRRRYLTDARLRALIQ